MDIGHFESPGAYLKSNFANRYWEMTKSERKACIKLDLRTSKHEKEDTRFNKVFHGYRVLVALMGGIAYGFMLLFRHNINVPLLKMVNQTALYLDSKGANYSLDSESLKLDIDGGGEFVWNNEIQHMIMSWYMMSYTLPQVFTTKLGTVIGLRLTVSISILLCSVSNLLIPIVAQSGWELVILMRLLNGLGASAIAPLMLDLIENWMPKSERFLGLTCLQVMTWFLASSTFWITGYLCRFHWSYAFYVTGAAGILVSILWYILVTNKPEQSWFISQKELEQISGNSAKKEESEEKVAKVASVEPTQWVHVLLVPSFYALLLVWCCQRSSLALFSFILPSYLGQFFEVNVDQIGRYCSLINYGCVLAALWPHLVLSFIKTRFRLSETVASKVIVAIVSAACMLSWGYIALTHQDQLLVLFLNRCFQHAIEIVGTATIMTNYSETGLSSLVYSMLNAVANLTVVFISTSTGYFFDSAGTSRASWSLVFYGLCSSQLVILIIYVLFVESKPIELRSHIQARITVAKIQQDNKSMECKESKCRKNQT